MNLSLLFGRLIQELNDLLAAHGAEYLNLDKQAQRVYILEHLSAENKATSKHSQKV